MFFGWKNAVPATQEGKDVICEFGDRRLSNLEDKEGNVVLLIRPQAAICDPNGVFTGIVEEASITGPTSDHTVECNGVTLKIQVSCGNIHLVGETIRFDPDPDMMWTVDVEPEGSGVENVPVRNKGLLERSFGR